MKNTLQFYKKIWLIVQPISIRFDHCCIESVISNQGWESLGTSDSEVNDSILKRLLMHLEAIFFMYISIRDFPKYIVYTSEFGTQSLLITSYLCDDQKAFVTNMTFYEQCHNQCSLHYNTIWNYVKNKQILFSFLSNLPFLCHQRKSCS